MKDCLAPYTERIENCCICSKNCEQVWVKISALPHGTIVVGVIYRPPSSLVNDDLSKINYLLHDLNVCFDNNKVDLIMLGDFNISIAKPSNAITRKLKALERKFHLKQVIHRPTRITKKTKSTIDLILSR